MTNHPAQDTTPSVIDEMITDLGAVGDEAAQLRDVLDRVAGLAHDLPEPSGDVRALLSGAVPMRPRRRAVLAVAAAGALALGGVSTAAATNNLPHPVQKAVADAADGILPVDIPHPVKPVNPPFDAPGHVSNTPKEPKPSDTPRPDNTTAPGQVQKATKPDPGAPGPAHPADPGAHGRAHNPDKSNHGRHAGAGNGTDGDSSDDDGGGEPRAGSGGHDRGNGGEGRGGKPDKD